ncbi:response regulator [Luteolibacter algae]|uniref:Response regulator n=1 Tax=Luteolibacter algae TaxID=454151 RepID=A0ABW5D691_9BACT
MNSSLKIFVVDDNAIMRLGLSQAINHEDDLELVGAAATGEEGIGRLADLAPDIVILDYHMPGMDGITCARRILAGQPSIRIILLSVFDSEEDIWKATQAGVSGYLTKKAGEIEDVIAAVHEVASGGTYFPATIAAKLRERRQQAELTPRELEVLKLLANGFSNKDIVDALGISLATVKLHITNLREKLGAVDRTQAVVTAYKKGILRLED